MNFVSIGICMELGILRSPNFPAYYWREADRANFSYVASVGRRENPARFRIAGEWDADKQRLLLHLCCNRPRGRKPSGLIYVWAVAGSEDL